MRGLALRKPASPGQPAEWGGGGGAGGPRAVATLWPASPAPYGMLERASPVGAIAAKAAPCGSAGLPLTARAAADHGPCCL